MWRSVPYRPQDTGRGDGMDERVWLNRAMHAGFFLLLAASASRLVARHALDAQTVFSLSVCGVLAVVYAVGVALWDSLGRALRWWLGAVLGCWLVLVVLAPSFAWCAVPLLFLCLRLLSPAATVLAAAVLTSAVVVGQVRLADVVEPSLVLGPVGIAAMTMVVFWELAAAHRRTGVLEERARLSREIHDTLAQGLSSLRMLLQAADRAWTAEPERARAYVRRAAEAAGENLDEARRFVRDLAPPGLRDGSLPGALAALCESVGGDTGLDVRFRQEGTEYPLDPVVAAALLRVAQGALANVREHSGAGRAVVTLSYLAGEVMLDVYDDGVGFDETAVTPAPGRGHGLRAMRERLAGVGGRLTIENAPGEGTAVAAAVPVAGAPDGRSGGPGGGAVPVEGR